MAQNTPPGGPKYPKVAQNTPKWPKTRSGCAPWGPNHIAGYEDGSQSPGITHTTIRV